MTTTIWPIQNSLEKPRLGVGPEVGLDMVFFLRVTVTGSVGTGWGMGSVEKENGIDERLGGGVGGDEGRAMVAVRMNGSGKGA